MDDQEKALAWQREESLRCPRCRTAEWEWTETKVEIGDDGQMKTRHERRDPAPYTVELHRCRGCEQLDVKSATLDRSTNRNGLYLRLSEVNR